MPTMTFDVELWRAGEVYPVDHYDFHTLCFLLRCCGGPRLHAAPNGTWWEGDVAHEAAMVFRAWLRGTDFKQRTDEYGATLPVPPRPDPMRDRHERARLVLPATEVVESFVEWASEGGFGCRLVTGAT